MPALFARVSDYLAENGRLVIQFPSKAQPRIEKLAAQHGLEVMSVQRLPPKELMLSLLSVLYLQIGFKSAVYLLRPRSQALPAAAE